MMKDQETEAFLRSAEAAREAERSEAAREKEHRPAPASLAAARRGLAPARVSALAIVLVTLAAVLVPPLVYYGTLSPCGMLESELERRLARDALIMPTGDPYELAGRSIGFFLARSYIESLVAGLRPGECIEGWWALVTEDELLRLFNSVSTTIQRPAVAD